MTTTLIGNSYVGPSTDPTPTATFGYDWMQTDTGNVYAASTTSQWVYVGNVNLSSLGNLSQSGGNMTGAITGNHGLMPLSGGDFSNMPTVNGYPLVTQNYVDQRDNYVLNQIQPQVLTALSNQSSLSLTANQQIVTGTAIPSSYINPITWDGLGAPPSTLQVTIPSFTYQDGTSPQPSEMSVSGSPSGIPGAFIGATNIAFFCISPATAPLTWACAWEYLANAWYALGMNYMVIATKAGS